MSQLTAFQYEWKKHGTCYSTLKPSCLPSGSPWGAEAVAYFQRMVELFKKLPTYEWLKSAGITPSAHKTYDLDDVIRAIKEASGVRCTPFLALPSNQSSLFVGYSGHLVQTQLDRDQLLFLPQRITP